MKHYENLASNRRVLLNSYAITESEKYSTFADGNISLTEKKAYENDNTMVTVICITYAHEKYIAEALESFIKQKTNFKFKVFVGEDAGPDGTANIVLNYAKKYPDIIIPFIRTTNMGAQHNLIDLCQRATSPYIAFCEGDDYWVDEYKLQKQVDYMESHKNIRVCTTKTEILAPKDWHLRDWYRKVSGNRFIIPDSIPNYKEKKEFSPANIVEINVAHTSTHFYRWNYDLEIPDWYYEGIIGDTPLLLLQLGSSNLGYIPQITSVYRINQESIFFSKDRETNFLKTRKDYVNYLSGLLTFAKQHNWEKYPYTTIENRIKLETANYLKILVDKNDTKGIKDFFAKYPMAGRISLNAYISFYNDQRVLSAFFSWDGYKKIARDKKFRALIKPIVDWSLKRDKSVAASKIKRKKFKDYLYNWAKKILFSSLYKICSIPIKRKDIWVFSGFRMDNYCDNTKYLYEYVIKNCPNIKAYWLTKNKGIYETLKKENKPVLLYKTLKCIKVVSRASIGVIDHFRMSDFGPLSGVNKKLKIVQLWHGVGLKAIGDLKNTNVPGVRLSGDCIINKNDSFVQKIYKRHNLSRYGYSRELFEKYFMLVCPGKERIEQVAKPLHVSLDKCFMSGHPRNELIHTMNPDNNVCKVLYAPTYRWNANKEKQLVTMIQKDADKIQHCMEKINGQLYIRLHPHTWRNYNSILESIAKNHDKIIVDTDKDIYTTLGTYSILVSDYSSIAYDFVLLNRPVVFFDYDYDDFINTECKLNYDYNEYSPGIKTNTWTKTLNAICKYKNNPNLDKEWRQKVRNELYDVSVNDENNSKRIVDEINRRLGER